MNAPQANDVIIIGAGPAGLAAAFQLKQQGIIPTVLEKEGKVASSWRKRHDHLKLNTYRGLSHQPGMRIPRTLGSYPSKDDYIEYLERYAALIDLPIKFNTEVRHIDVGSKGSKWIVQTSSGEISATHVVVATGSDKDAVMPEWPGMENYRGTIIHAGEFKNAEDYADKSVMIVGAGNSAFDIGNYLAGVSLLAGWISVRRTTAVVPKRFLGLPAQALLVLSSWLPEGTQDTLIGLMSRLVVGDLSRYGMKRPDKGGLRKFREEGVTLAVDDGFARAIQVGKFQVVPEIERFSKAAVHLIDGQTLKPDIVLCATGYRPDLGPIVGHLNVLDTKGYPSNLGGEESYAAPGLWFIGHNSSPYGNMNIRRRESLKLATNINKCLKRLD